MPKEDKIRPSTSIEVDEPEPEDRGLRRLILIVLWSVATGAGVGAGWFLMQQRENPLLLALPLGVAQGLVLARSWRRAALWFATTGLSWIVAVIVMGLVGLRANTLLIGHGWTTAGDNLIGQVILLLTGVAVPVMAGMQSLLIRRWVGSDDAIRWFGVSVFSFMMLTFAGRLLTDAWVSDTWVRGLVEIDLFEPRLWVIAAAWGAFLGWAMSGMPEVMIPKRDRQS